LIRRQDQHRRGAWLAAGALALYLAGVAVWVGYDRRSVREVFPPGSVYSTADEGLSLALAYLRERATQEKIAGRPTVLRRRIDGEALPARAVVFRVLPTVVPFLPAEEKDEKGSKDGKDGKEKPTSPARGGREGGRAGEGPGEGVPLLTAGEDSWLRSGGRLVLAVDDRYGPLGVETLAGKAAVRKVFPIWPGVSALHPTRRLGLNGAGLAGSQAVVLAGVTPVVAREAVGAGELILLSCPEVLENRLLGKAHHLALLEALAGLQEKRPVFFDERAHGYGDDAGVTETLGAWGLGPLLLLALLAAAAAGWRAAVRIGAADRDDRDTRSDAVELVDSLADLYDRALGRGDAVRLYHESFRETVAAETGLRGAALEARTGDLLAGGFSLPDADPKNDLSQDRFDRDLRMLNEAFRRVHDAKRNAKRDAKRA
jgi:hypothetical protein